MHDAFALSSTPVVANISERVESLLLHGSKLYVGCQNGSLHVYNLQDPSAESQQYDATLEKTVKGFAKKSIEQLGVVKECNSLVSLSDGTIYLHDLHTLQKQTVLGTSSATKGQAGIFALETSVQTGNPFATTSSQSKEKASTTQSPASKVGASRRAAGKGKEVETHESTDAPVVATTLAVGCRRRLVIFWWRDGQWQDPREVSLPHQIRSLAFPLPHSLFLGYSTSEYGVVSLPFVPNPISKTALTLNEPFTPGTIPPPIASTSGTSGVAGSGTGHLGAIPGLGGLGGLAAKTGGYMGLGGKVERNLVSKVRDGEVVVQRESSGVFLDATGNPSRSNSVEYPLQPEEMVTCWPYLISILPAPAAVSNLTKQQSYDPLNALPTLHIHTLPTLSPTQAIRVPSLSTSPEKRPVSIIDVPPTPITQTARLLTTGPKGKAPLAILTHPFTDTGPKTSSVSPSSIYLVSLLPWQSQIDSLIALGQYEDALSLVSSLDAADHHLSDAQGTIKKLRILAGLSLFVTKKQYDKAIDIFIEENVNPAKVVALFPKAISGKLYRDREDIEEAWGGRSRENYIKQESERRHGASDGRQRQRQTTVESATSETADEQKAWRFSPASKKKPEDDTASVKSKRSYLTTLKDAAREVTGTGETTTRDAKPAEDLSYKLSVDVLMRYLPDRRQQFLRALSSLSPRVRPTPSSPLPEKPSNSREDLFAFPDAPLTEYKPEQLQRVAQVVETALFKCYLHAKPGLLGPLCRIENWCEVEEVEELLLEAHKYRELLDLYNGKQMHEKAIQLLQRMANEQEDGDAEDKVMPTIQYLQKLGSKHLDLIFGASKWVFSKAPALGIQIFTADLEEVESLPRHAVSLFLDKSAPTKEVYVEYLEHIVFSLREDGPEFHERLAELYLDAVESENKSKAATAESSKAYKKLLDFLESSQQYRADRLLGRIPDGQMYEVRAILLGKLGQHDGALQIYVYRLQDHARAEEYCKRIYDSSDPARASIFLTLLKVYLRPRKEDLSSTKDGNALFGPALSLLSSQATRMDPNQVLDLLPPLMTIQELRTFLLKSMRRRIDEKHFRKVEVGVWRARTDQIERTLVDLEGRKVKVTDSRLCPQCHKRLGTSVIAVHSPAGVVTHYQCTERWRESQQRTAFSE